MYYERLFIEPTDDGWIRFQCPDQPWKESATDSLELPPGFNLALILEAVAATGWTKKLDGEWRIQNSRSCRDLVRLLDEMLTYFEGPNEPGAEIWRIKSHVDAILADELEPGVGSELSPWHYARLDLMLREELAEAARTLDGIWEHEVQHFDVSQIRTLVIRNFRRDFQAQSDLLAGRMSSSARTSKTMKDRERNVG